MESESSSESSSDSDDSDEQDVQLATQWRVIPDVGELDHSILLREADVENGKKASGWTNPLGWTDDGADDDLVVTQLKADLRYDVSEGPTKVDFGDSDHVVVLRERDIANGKKASGWTNPLGWSDDGEGDESVLTQYDVSEGPTKVDFGDSDHVVVLRERDIANGKKASGWTNPLGWSDDGEGDESVLTQQ
jgi:hypothetical protein